MELDSNFYRLTFTTGQEFFVESDIVDRVAFLKVLTNSGIFTSGNGFITLQRLDTDPIDIKADKLFSVQKAPKAMIGTQTKIWKLLE